MMNLPNLPTDNLYKFIALTGVIFFMLALFYPEYKRTEIREEIIVFNGDVKKLTLESAKIKQKVKEIKNEVERLDKKANCNCVSIVNDSIISRTRIIEGTPELMALSDKIDNLIGEWLNLNREEEKKVIEVETKRDLIDSKQSDLEVLEDVSNSLGPLSIVLAVLGFLSWYHQTQKLQDKVLKEQANQFLNNELCQSCGMRLNNQINYPLFTEEDKKSIYCKTCFSTDGFIEPDLTLKQMEGRVKKRCRELGYSKLVAFILSSRIKGLHRWEKKFRW